MDAEALTHLPDLLLVDRLDDDLFLGVSPDADRFRIFGGQPLAQGLMAASQTTADDRRVHSLHASFVRAGDASQPIEYRIRRLRDSRTFSTRRVEAWQGDREIFEMLLSFQPLEEGLEHQLPMPANTPDPEDLRPRIVPIAQDDPAKVADLGLVVYPVEERMADGVRVRTEQSARRVWIKVADRLPDEHIVHAAIMAYASDMTLLVAAGVPHGLTLSEPNLQCASLDHAMWFHRDFRIDDFLLHEVLSPSLSGSRALTEGRVFRRDGVLAVTTSQEGMVRQLPEPG